MGDDQAIVDAARVSIAGEDTKPVSSNRGLIRHLMRKGHTGPFEMAELKFHAKMPIFVARQWVRHRTANLNEMSARYGKLPSEYYVPEEERITKQSTSNKQGSSDELMPNPEGYQDGFDCEADNAHFLYEHRLSDGMTRELARINLPLSTYTQWIWKMDLHNLLHFLQVRKDKDAQYEIRVYADAMADMVKPLFPLTWEAFEDFRLHAMTLSRIEIAAIQQYSAGACAITDLPGFPTRGEADEFQEKLRRLGLNYG